MKKRVISAKDAPAAIGPYSQAVKSGKWLFFSGQIPLDPTSGALVEGDAAQQAERVLQNIQAVLQGAKADFDRVVKSNLYLIDMADFAAVNEVYMRYFQPPYPVRTTVQVAALPKGSRVELEVLARVKKD